MEKVLVAPSTWESKAARLAQAALSLDRALCVGRVFVGGCKSTVGKSRANGEMEKKTLTRGRTSQPSDAPPGLLVKE